ncbi:MAG TPA: NfeD family protein [Candidatus Methylomirabilis sp.]|jgi:membrane protein implicated in regulation of membrane protease activity
MPRGIRAYLILQAPEALVVGLILWLFHRWIGLSPAWVAGLLALWVLKEIVTYRLLREFLGPPRTGPEALIGARGTTPDRLAPDGYILLAAERWRAESLRPEEIIPPGSTVIVRAIRGLTLIVEAEGPGGTP